MVRIHPDPPGQGEHGRRAPRHRGAARGAVAQLGERLLCKQEVVGSIPSSSTRWWWYLSVAGQHSALGFAEGAQGQSSTLRAVVFFNNLEGKGSLGLDESLGGH
jgi:hypothetical protein